MRAVLLAVATLAAGIVAPHPAGAASAPGDPPFSWTGIYLGVEAGGGFGSTKHTNAVTGVTSGNNTGLDGGIIGGTYGFNWQLDPAWVLGFEGDISWSDISDKFQDKGSGFCSPAADSCITNLHWLGTDRLRVGYRTDDDWLFYATGGVAYGDIRATVLGGCCTNETHTRVGYAVGGGVETPIAPQLSLKLEYLFVDLGRETNYHQIPGLGGTAELVTAHLNVVRFGINYEFEP